METMAGSLTQRSGRYTVFSQAAIYIGQDGIIVSKIIGGLVIMSDSNQMRPRASSIFGSIALVTNKRYHMRRGE